MLCICSTTPVILIFFFLLPSLTHICTCVRVGQSIQRKRGRRTHLYFRRESKRVVQYRPLIFWPVLHVWRLVACLALRFALVISGPDGSSLVARSSLQSVSNSSLKSSGHPKGFFLFFVITSISVFGHFFACRCYTLQRLLLPIAMTAGLPLLFGLLRLHYNAFD